MAHSGPDYRITFEPGLARVHFRGGITMPGIIAASEELYGAAEWTPGQAELWDFSEIESLNVTPEGLRAVADFEGGLANVVGPGRTALVVSRQDDYDIGTLYAHLPKGNGREHCTFWGEAEARAWLGSRASP